MKKIALLFSAVALFAMTSCSKNACYECTMTVSSMTTKVDICDGKFTNTVGGTASASVNLPSGKSEKQYADDLEAAGYTCSKK